MTARSSQVLLIQVRDDDDPGREHERHCIAHRLAAERAELVTVNGLSGPMELGRLDRVDLLILGGSGDYSVHDPRSATCVAELRRLLDHVLQRQLPTFGICFGHQLVGYHLGATVRTDDAHAEIGTVPVQLPAKGQRDPVFGELPVEFGAHTGHSDHVTSVPPGVELLAEGQRLRAQAFKVRGAPLYTTQFHPDMTGAEAITRYLTYQESFAETLADQVNGAVDRFRPGQDAATLLLARFLEHVTQDDT
ncbi:MAG: gamma-glutamyl-gamma-aminobutyrate hydrolase family protein [Deltaproteobacteria bacterium]|nr:gamma-glutamyl-gamma-aminobutyrate hydrolase family protein [Deltaproteobacteria bacterium]